MTDAEELRLIALCKTRYERCALAMILAADFRGGMRDDESAAMQAMLNYCIRRNREQALPADPPRYADAYEPVFGSA